MENIKIKNQHKAEKIINKNTKLVDFHIGSSINLFFDTIKKKKYFELYKIYIKRKIEYLIDFDDNILNYIFVMEYIIFPTLKKIIHLK
jgi:hypothetical protein